MIDEDLACPGLSSCAPFFSRRPLVLRFLPSPGVDRLLFFISVVFFLSIDLNPSPRVAREAALGEVILPDGTRRHFVFRIFRVL